jgi:hypothetical protein
MSDIVVSIGMTKARANNAKAGMKTNHPAEA